MGQAGGRGRREVVTLSLVFILSYVSPGARKNPKHVPIGPHKCRQAAEGYPVSPRSERAVALTSWGSRPSLLNDDNVVILCTSDATETALDEHARAGREPSGWKTRSNDSSRTVVVVRASGGLKIARTWILSET